MSLSTRHFYACSTNVHGILGEFLDHRGRAVYDLSGSYLLGDQGIEHRYLTQEEETSLSQSHSYSTHRIVADHAGCVSPGFSTGKGALIVIPREGARDGPLAALLGR